MSLSDQIAVYSAAIAGALAMMRLIAGLTGSKAVKRHLLLTAVWSTIALAGALAGKGLLQMPSVREYIFAHLCAASSLSAILFLTWLVAVGYTFGFGVLLRLYVRSQRFKDWGTLRNLRAVPPATWVRSLKRLARQDQRDYEKTAPARSTLVKEIFKQHFNSADQRPPIIISGNNPYVIRRKVVEYCLDLVDKTDEELNYVCCNASPFEIWELFQNVIQEKGLTTLEKLKSRIVFVDAYTRIFGFADEIVLERVRELVKKQHVLIVPAESAAGIHSGTAKAFKYLKSSAEEEKRTRGPCTVIYDSLSVLTIAETEEEVAEFIVHLVAAEREYGMHTILIEVSSEKRSSTILNAMMAACGKPIEL